jgi:hypothetical protein
MMEKRLSLTLQAVIAVLLAAILLKPPASPTVSSVPLSLGPDPVAVQLDTINGNLVALGMSLGLSSGPSNTGGGYALKQRQAIGAPSDLYGVLDAICFAVQHPSDPTGTAGLHVPASCRSVGR